MTASHHTFGLTGGWCQWHDGPTDTELGTLISDTNSGPPQINSACQPCMEDVAAAVAERARLAERES